MLAHKSVYKSVYKVRRSAGKLVIYTILICVAAVCLIPFLWMVSTSLKSSRAIFAFPPEWLPNPVHWSNYRDAWTIVPFAKFFQNTVAVALLCTIGTLISSSMAAYGFARLRFKGRSFLFAVMLATMMIPWEITAVPLYVEFNALGWIDTLKPLIVPSFFGSAFNIFLLRQFFYSIPYDLDEAALIDGCRPFDIYLRIMLPIIRPAMVAVAIFQIVAAWNDFMGPLIFLNRTENFTMTLGLNLFRNSFLIEWDRLMAAASFTTVVPIIVFFFGQKQLIGGIATSGLKR